MSKPVPFSFT